MELDRWRRVEELYHAAAARAEGERAAFLREACAGDDDLLREVESLLAEGSSKEGVLELTAMAGAAQQVSDASAASLTGRRLGAYQILAPLGAGGMAEVYRARDTKLGREVAIKVLPAAFTANFERLARFEREARVLAALNHPRIAAIHGLESVDGIHALVLELVEGDTLADRIAGRRSAGLPVTEALGIARQIAEALDAAHEKGIVHRDLKPANIKITPDGVVKVLDFGLAKLQPGDTEDAKAPADSPTVTVDGTRAGVILGTAAYMSPEQARGQPVDKRTDIWAFGCVLFEMLTGRRAFDGTDATETIAAVVRGEPEWPALPPATPPKLIAVLKRCLQKDPRLRARDIGDLRFELDEISRAPAPAGTSTAIPRVALWRRAMPYAGVVLLTVAITGLVAWLLRPAAPDRPVARFVITLPEDERFSALDRHAVAISPDDTHIVYAANGRLNLRRLDQLVAAPIRTTEGAPPTSNPFFSPNGQWIGFWQNDQLKKVSVNGGSAVVLCAADNPWGASWSADDSIVFGQGPRGIMRVAAAGGTPELVVKVDAGESAHGPQVLPGGRAILFTLRPSGVQMWDESRIVIQSLTTGERKEVIKGGADARYLPAGYLVYALKSTVLAVPFDLDTLNVTGGPVPVLDTVVRAGALQANMNTGASHFSVSARGTLVYVEDSGEVADRFQGPLTWVDRNGRETAINAPARTYRYPRLSPDGHRIAVDTTDEQEDIWIWNLEGETLTRLTIDSASDSGGIWTSDGQRVIFYSTRSGSRAITQRNLYWQASDGSGAATRLTDSPNTQMPNAVSPDGTKLVFAEGTTIGGNDLWLLPLQGERRAQLLVQTPFTERNADISPNGRWLAYESDESGQFEVYVRPFPNVDDSRWKVSTGGGRVPLWARNGREIFFMTLRGESLMAAAILESPGSAAFRSRTPIKLFDTRGYLVPPTVAGRPYDVSADGGRFLMIKPVSARRETSTPQSITVVQNWQEELKQRVPTR